MPIELMADGGRPRREGFADLGMAGIERIGDLTAAIGQGAGHLDGAGHQRVVDRFAAAFETVVDAREQRFQRDRNGLCAIECAAFHGRDLLLDEAARFLQAMAELVVEISALDRKRVFDRAESVGQRGVEALGMAAEAVGCGTALSDERVLELLQPRSEGLVDAIAVGGDGGNRFGGDEGEASVDRLHLTGQARDRGPGIGDEALMERLGVLAERAGCRLGIVGELLVHGIEMPGEIVHRTFGDHVQPLLHGGGMIVEHGQGFARDPAELSVDRLAMLVERFHGAGRCRQEKSLQLRRPRAEAVDRLARDGVEPSADGAGMLIERGHRVGRRALQALVQGLGVFGQRADRLLSGLHQAAVHGFPMLVERAGALRGDGVELVVHRIDVAGEGGQGLVRDPADALLNRVGMLSKSGDGLVGRTGEPLVHVGAMRGKRVRRLRGRGGDATVEILVVCGQGGVHRFGTLVKAFGMSIQDASRLCHSLVQALREPLRSAGQRSHRVLRGGAEAGVEIFVVSDQRGIGRFEPFVEAFGMRIEGAGRLGHDLVQALRQSLRSGGQGRDRILRGGGDTAVHVLVVRDERGIDRFEAVVETFDVGVERAGRLGGNPLEAILHVFVLGQEGGVGRLHAVLESTRVSVEGARRLAGNTLEPRVERLRRGGEGDDRLRYGRRESAVHLVVVGG